MLIACGAFALAGGGFARGLHGCVGSINALLNGGAAGIVHGLFEFGWVQNYWGMVEVKIATRA